MTVAICFAEGKNDNRDRWANYWIILHRAEYRLYYPDGQRTLPFDPPNYGRGSLKVPA
jgi:hypothetical protein